MWALMMMFLSIVDPSRLATVHRVALVAVYGPETIPGGFSRGASEQALYDTAESRVIAALKARGYEVMPLDATKALVESDYPRLYIDNLPPRTRRDAERSPQFVDAIRKGWIVSTNGKPLSSANTHLFMGADYRWETAGQTHQNGRDASASSKQAPASPDDASRAALAQLAAKQGADAYVVVRVVPAIATTVAAETSKWNPLGTIKKGFNAMNAIREGDHGMATIDLAIVDTHGQTLLQDQFVGMSKVTSGPGGGFNLRMSAGDIDRLTNDALAEALPQLDQHLGGAK
jgi:hypothetical protein